MTTTRFVVLFRGVGGKTQLPVAVLRRALEDGGFSDVATYINSGNAVLSSSGSRSETQARVMRIAADSFGFAKTIFLRTADEWDALIAANPFPHVENGTHLHAAVLSDAPSADAMGKVRAHSVDGEGFEVVDRVAYLHTPHGFGRSKLAERFDRDIGVENSARNWNTVTRLAGMLHTN